MVRKFLKRFSGFPFFHNSDHIYSSPLPKLAFDFLLNFVPGNPLEMSHQFAVFFVKHGYDALIENQWQIINCLH